jgi:hypothetical protein
MQASAQQSGEDLLRLTVPASALPAGCSLNPNPGGFLPTNPAIVTNPAILGFMHGLVFGPAPGETAVPSPTPERMKVMVGSMSARAAQVEVGYAATYREDDGSHEIGVFALRMKDLAAVQAYAGSGAGTRITKGTTVIFHWADTRPGVKARGCRDVVHRHLEGVGLK